ncbi:MAG TPA: HAD family hydrolase [Phycisphaerae bacterium]|nr:HAD family hydrolase [Phycisphaerae bacterium]
MSRRRFDALFIDFYGTVTSGDRQAVEDTSLRVVQDLHLPVSGPDFAVEWGKKFFAAADERNHGRFRNLFEIECDTLVETLEARGVHGVDPVPYVNRLVDYWADPTLHPDSARALDSIDVPICVVSNADTKDLLSAIEKHDLRFDHVITSEDVNCYKPAPAIFDRALAEVGLPPERVIHAGDSLHADVSGAGPLGIATVWVCRTGRIYDVGTSRPDYKVSSLKGLSEILA